MDEIFKDLDFIMNECKIPLQLLCKKCERIAVLKVVIELFLEKIDFALSDGLGAYSDFLKEEVEKSDIQIILFSKTIALLLVFMDFRKFQ
jgi:hypothetical protein